MATYIEMPKLSDTMTEGTLAKWIKNTGDTVEIGDVIAEVETDKATMEMESFDEGVLHEIYVVEGQKVPVGGRLAVLVEDGEEPPSADEADADAGAGADTAAPPVETPSAEEEEEATPTGSDPEPQSATSGSVPTGERIAASPLARKIAAERGVDLAGLQGSGPGGRIVKVDVETAEPGAKPSDRRIAFAAVITCRRR